MKITVLASGSKGNCCYVEGGSGALLIDAGLSAKETLRRLELAGGQKDLIDAVLVTHEHTDHIRGVDVLARRLGIPVIATQGTLWEFEEKRTSKKPVEMESCRVGEAFSVGEFSVEAFSTYHDACDPCGYLLSMHDERFGYCTDTGKLTPKMTGLLRGCDALVLESNHCPYMLEHGPYPAFLKKRISDPMRGHLSNNEASNCLKELGGHVGSVVLAHLSEENNTPEKALETAYECAGSECGGINLSVAAQHEISGSIKI